MQNGTPRRLWPSNNSLAHFARAVTYFTLCPGQNLKITDSFFSLVLVHVVILLGKVVFLSLPFKCCLVPSESGCFFTSEMAAFRQLMKGLLQV